MVRRDICEQIIESDPYLHKSDHFLMGDTQLWAEIANISKFYYIPLSLATHRITEESATRSKNKINALRFRLSGNELLQYLCDKYALSAEHKKTIKIDWKNISLTMAFHSRNSDMADRVRKEKIKFTFKNWVEYLGAKYAYIYYFIHKVLYIKNMYNRDKDYGIWR